MRRKDRVIADEEAWDLLHQAEYGVLSTVSEDGRPYGVPLNFCIVDTGSAAEIHGVEKQAALEALLRKYSPGFFDEGLSYVRTSGEKIRVFRIGIDHVSGKARRR